MGMGLSGLEPPTSRLSGVRSNQLSYKPLAFYSVTGNGDGEIRTLDPLLARQVLSQLSYTPTDAVPSSIVSLYLLFLLDGLALAFANGLEWTRTTDLTLIRRAL